MATQTSNQATITKFGLQEDSGTTLYAMWDWTKKNTDKYLVKWEYCTGGVWFIGNNSSNSVDTNDPAASRQSTYNIPSNATCVRFTVKPVSKKKGNTKRVYWTANWSTAKTYDVKQTPPIAPTMTNPKLENYKLTIELDNLSLNATSIHFQVVKRNGVKFDIVSTSDTTIQFANSADEAALKNGYARYACYVDAGGEYRVRARSSRDGINSDWSAYSGSVFAIPSVPSGFTTMRATSDSSVYLEWTEVDSAKSYDIEYTTKKEYFDGSSETTTETGIEFNHFEFTNLNHDGKTGVEYFFRVRAVNTGGTSKWSEIKSIVLGKKPAAPTTWSSTTTVIAGEPLNLYWVHNSEDGSSQTYAHLEIYADDNIVFNDVIKNTTEEDEKDKTSVYAVDTSKFTEGTVLKWRVRTAGITNETGEWSIQRTIDVYAPPTLALTITDKYGAAIDTIASFPVYIKALAGPNTQSPIGYHVAITSNSSYETVDNVGNEILINQGDRIYSEYFETTENPLRLELLPSSITLENNVSYTVTCTSSMNSSLSGLATTKFTVAWSEENYWPNAEVEIDEEAYIATILPYCEEEDENGEFHLVEDVTLAVYRREFDGRFTELISGIDNVRSIQITDPHPALDYARYRIVATSKTTGSVSYYDIPGYEVGGHAVVIQWNEAWSNFDTPDTSVPVEPSWVGSMLKLPYNIDVSDTHKPDVSLIEYIGREHPISYYGTQLGVSSSWKMEIEKDDEETLYGLRRLSRWMGDAYVREPSGSGYWAHVTVSFNQNHCAVTIPVTLDITRVEGGI